MDKQYYVYILASKKNGTLYVGITSELIKRVYKHKEKLINGFTKNYNVNKLVYYEIFKDPENAIKSGLDLSKAEMMGKKMAEKYAEHPLSQIFS